MALALGWLRKRPRLMKWLSSLLTYVRTYAVRTFCGSWVPTQQLNASLRLRQLTSSAVETHCARLEKIAATSERNFQINVAKSIRAEIASFKDALALAEKAS